MRTLIMIACALAGCTEEGGTGRLRPDARPSADASSSPPPGTATLTGSWTGDFTSDNSLAAKGTFTLDLTEDAASHAVTGPVTCTISQGFAGAKLTGTFTGTRTDTALNGAVAFAEVLDTGTLTFQEAPIADTTIAGMFALDVTDIGVAIKGTGSYSVERAP